MKNTILIKRAFGTTILFLVLGCFASNNASAQVQTAQLFKAETLGLNQSQLTFRESEASYIPGTSLVYNKETRTLDLVVYHPGLPNSFKTIVHHWFGNYALPVETYFKSNVSMLNKLDLLSSYTPTDLIGRASAQSINMYGVARFGTSKLSQNGNYFELDGSSPYAMIHGSTWTQANGAATMNALDFYVSAPAGSYDQAYYVPTMRLDEKGQLSFGSNASYEDKIALYGSRANADFYGLGYKDNALVLNVAEDAADRGFIFKKGEEKIASIKDNTLFLTNAHLPLGDNKLFGEVRLWGDWKTDGVAYQVEEPRAGMFGQLVSVNGSPSQSSLSFFADLSETETRTADMTLFDDGELKLNNLLSFGEQVQGNGINRKIALYDDKSANENQWVGIGVEDNGLDLEVQHYQDSIFQIVNGQKMAATHASGFDVSGSLSVSDALNLSNQNDAQNPYQILTGDGVLDFKAPSNRAKFDFYAGTDKLLELKSSASSLHTANFRIFSPDQANDNFSDAKLTLDNHFFRWDLISETSGRLRLHRSGPGLGYPQKNDPDPEVVIDGSLHLKNSITMDILGDREKKVVLYERDPAKWFGFGVGINQNADYDPVTSLNVNFVSTGDADNKGKVDFLSSGNSVASLYEDGVFELSNSLNFKNNNDPSGVYGLSLDGDDFSFNSNRVSGIEFNANGQSIFAFNDIDASLRAPLFFLGNEEQTEYDMYLLTKNNDWRITVKNSGLSFNRLKGDSNTPPLVTLPSLMVEHDLSIVHQLSFGTSGSGQSKQIALYDDASSDKFVGLGALQGNLDVHFGAINNGVNRSKIDFLSNDRSVAKLYEDGTFETEKGLIANGDNTHGVDSWLNGTIVMGGEDGVANDANLTIKDEYYDNYALWVKKGIVTEDIAFAPANTWNGQQGAANQGGLPVPDYVFAKDYNLRSLEDLKSFIDQYSHLPEVPSAKEINTEGFSLVQMDMNLLKKIEELVLYTLDQEAKIKAQEQQMSKFKAELEQIKSLLKGK